MNNAKLLLNKVINEDDVGALKRYNIDENDMQNEIDKATYKFIMDYSDDNGGNAPSYALVASRVDGFLHIPEVTDSYLYLAKHVKDVSIKQRVYDWFESGKFENSLDGLPGQEFIEEWLPSEISKIQAESGVNESVGIDVKRDIDTFYEQYLERKEGKSFKQWKSKFSAIGTYSSSDMYTVIGESGRGKSILTLEDAIYVASQGANVLIWSLEMSWYEVLVRIYTSLSGDEGVNETVYKGMNMDAGFDANELRTGGLDSEFEEVFHKFLKSLNDKLSGTIVVRSIDEEGFSDRSLRALEADIVTTGADYVLIDPFYYLHYESNTSRTTGGDASNTSQTLRLMTGRLGVVTVVTVQSDVASDDDSDAEFRELRIPKRSEVRTTGSLLQDAKILIGIDSNYQEGRAIVANLKGRDGGEGDISNIMYLPQYGIIDELQTGDISGFDF